jgi:hypothetical protein
MSWLWLIATTVLLTSCASVSKFHPLAPEEAGAHRLAQVIGVATRHEMGARYDELITSALYNVDPCDGRFAGGIVHCCGGPNLSIWFCVPSGMDIEPGDIVEVTMGRQPENGSPGRVNIAIQVRHQKADAENHCHWDPPRDGLWMRTLYCDWMAQEGWVQKEHWSSKTWLKPVPTTGAQ